MKNTNWMLIHPLTNCALAHRNMFLEADFLLILDGKKTMQCGFHAKVVSDAKFSCVG